MTLLTGQQSFSIQAADIQSVSYILQNMRIEDKKEILATEFDDDLIRIAQKFTNHCALNWVFCLPDGRPVAFLAGSCLWPGFAQIGFAATSDWPAIALPVSKWILLMKKYIFTHFHVDQAICFVDERHHKSQRWLKWMGFTEKCRLDHAGRNQETFFIYLLNVASL